MAGTAVRPVVDPLGVCNSYERRPLDMGMNIHCHDEWTWRHHDCCDHMHMHETILKYEIDSRLRDFTDKFESDLSGRVDNFMNERVEPAIQDSVVKNVGMTVAAAVQPAVEFAMSAVAPGIVNGIVSSAVDMYVADAIETSISGTISAVVDKVVDDKIGDINVVEGQHNVRDYNDDGVEDEKDEDFIREFLINGGTCA